MPLTEFLQFTVRKMLRVLVYLRKQRNPFSLWELSYGLSPPPYFQSYISCVIANLVKLFPRSYNLEYRVTFKTLASVENLHIW